MQVTAALTDLAVASVQAALRFLLRQEAARGRLAPPDPRSSRGQQRPRRARDGQDGRGRAELFQRHRPDRVLRSRGADAGARHRAADRSSCASRRRWRGCCSSAPATAMCSGSICGCGRIRPRRRSRSRSAAALHYYEREGRTWERAAMIKARPCAGDARAGEALVAEIAPFVWRKHLDFAALADVHDMKRQMQTFRGQSEIAVEGHNVKVGRGGIREIEFFAQTQQLIAGGRHPELRVRPTLEALERAGLEQLDHLRGARRTDRGLHLPAPGRAPAADGRGRADPCLARRRRGDGAVRRASSAMPAAPPSPGDLLGHLNVVQGHYGKLFEGDPTGTAKLPAADYGAGPDDPRLIEHLATLGFKKPVDGGENRAAMDDRRLSRAARRGDAQRLRRVRSGTDRRPGRTPKSPTTRWPRSTASCRRCSAAGG